MSREVDEVVEKAKSHKFGIFSAAFVAIAGVVGACSYQIVPAQNFGVRVRFGQVVDQQMKPDIYPKLPIMDTIHILKENTIILEETMGEGANTQDQNHLKALMRVHYQNDPKSGVIAYHVEDMASDDGKELLAGLMDQSFNAAAGYGKAVDSLNDPRKFLFTLADNLQWRLKQNNVAIELDAFELLEMRVGDGTNPLRMPIQMRLKRDGADQQWKIEDITGPTGTPARSGGAPSAPAAVPPVEQPAPGK
jgi:regulator of protease activity HflC (stomatin/prohibitin superfamily)